MKWWRKAAELGIADAMNRLGMCYFEGEGVRKNYKEAASLFNEAALQGHGWAQNNLGRCYEEGKGVKKDNDLAIRWYSQALNNGVNEAAMHLISLGAWN